jgi:protein O-mannosyl-transferase
MDAENPVPRTGPLRWLWVPLAVALLSWAAYGWAIKLPFIADDYLQISLGRKYGSPANWGALAADPLYRCRATSLVVTWLTEPWAGLQPLWYNLTSLLLHVLNACLVFSLGAWKRIGWTVSAAAACFFAIHEGQQEAIVWYAALPELLVVFFVLLCVLCWILLHKYPHRAWLWYSASVAAFLLALLSKESSVAAVGLLALVEVLEFEGWKRAARRLAPFALLAVLYFVADYAGRAQNQHYHDGTFALLAPFWLTLPRSLGRMLFLWGLVSLIALCAWRARARFPLVATSLCWMTIALLPYSFLTYMPVVPSRHTYMAAV